VQPRGEDPDILGAAGERHVAAAPLQRRTADDAMRVGEADLQRRLVPVDGFRHGPHPLEIRPCERACDLERRAIDRHLEDAAPPQLGRDLSVDLHRARERVGAPCGALPASGVVDPRDGVGNRQHRTTDGLRRSPGHAHFGDGRGTPLGPLRHDALDPRQRHQKQDRQKRHDEKPCRRRVPHANPPAATTPAGQGATKAERRRIVAEQRRGPGSAPGLELWRD
jgi:hypothetical protein